MPVTSRNRVCVNIITVIRNTFSRSLKIENQRFFRHSLRIIIESMTIVLCANNKYFAIEQQLAEENQTTLDVMIQQFLDTAEAREAKAQRHMYEIHDRNILQKLSP